MYFFLIKHNLIKIYFNIDRIIFVQILPCVNSLLHNIVKNCII